MMNSSGSAGREIERKYDAGPAGALPALDGVDGVALVGEPQTYELVATYFDTVDLRLAARGMRLRRRTGGTDAGWHVKLPALKGAKNRDGALEVHRPLGDPAADPSAPPEDLLRLVDAAARAEPLRAVLRVATTRVERPLLARVEAAVEVAASEPAGGGGAGGGGAGSGAGKVLALIAEDQVTSEVLASGTRSSGLRGGVSSWREVEVELVDGDEALLDAVEKRLVAAGMRPAAAGANKALRALGARARPAWPAISGTLSRTSPAGAVLAAYLREQVATVLEYDPRVRLDEHDAVHKMRVATRRLRSALKTFRPLLDRVITDPINDELRWLAAELGEVRDAEVLRDRLLRDVAELPGELVLGPVEARVTAGLTGDYQRAREKLLVELSGERYFALLDALDDLVVLPPVTARAEEPADAVLPGLAGKAYRRLIRQLDAADAAKAAAAEGAGHPDGLESPDDGTPHVDSGDELLHEARKDAKRLRYAGESLAPVFGSDASTLASRAEDLQEVLGEHQDGVVMTDLLRRMGLDAQAAGENAFTYGLLLGQERCRAAATEDRLPELRERLTAKTTRRWLR